MVYQRRGAPRVGPAGVLAETLSSLQQASSTNTPSPTAKVKIANVIEQVIESNHETTEDANDFQDSHPTFDDKSDDVFRHPDKPGTGLVRRGATTVLNTIIRAAVFVEAITTPVERDKSYAPGDVEEQEISAYEPPYWEQRPLDPDEEDYHKAEDQHAHQPSAPPYAGIEDADIPVIPSSYHVTPSGPGLHIVAHHESHTEHRHHHPPDSQSQKATYQQAKHHTSAGFQGTPANESRRPHRTRGP